MGVYEDKWGLYIEEGEEDREQIQKWREKRVKVNGVLKSYYEFLVYAFNMDILYSFVHNFNFMVLIQMVLAGIAVFVMKKYNIMFDVQVSLFVSPIVFPLAFSINIDFQRREKVLEDLAVFKSSGMVWFFCMREWKLDAGLENDWITAVHYKLKSLLFFLREYLLTSRTDHRNVILRAVYEEFSDTNQLIERLRASKLPANTAIISRAIHLLNMMCLSFERLRVIREYRSPRSIRSFNKVLIMLLPILLSPYFVYLGFKNKSDWEPYYIAVLVAFVFSALQGVQDKLDDPFDGIGEDDIKLDTIDEWTFDSLEPVMKRTMNVGRFTVKVHESPVPRKRLPSFRRKSDGLNLPVSRRLRQPLRRTTISTDSIVIDIPENKGEPGYQKYAEILQGLRGNSRIPRNESRRVSVDNLAKDTSSHHMNSVDQLDTIFEKPPQSKVSQVSFQDLPKITLHVPLEKDEPETITFNTEQYNFSSSPGNKRLSKIPLIGGSNSRLSDYIV